LSTVGFGDITPVTDAARLTVAVQMICDLVVIGILVKPIVGVAKHARAQRTSAADDRRAWAYERRPARGEVHDEGRHELI
jgi:Ion channel